MLTQNVILNGKTVLVTGAAGFIGSNLVMELLRTVKAVNIVGLDNMNDYYDVRLKDARLQELEQYPDFRFIKGNIADKSLIDSLFAEFKPQIVVNLAAQAGVRYSITNPDVYIESNIIGFYNIYVYRRGQLQKMDWWLIVGLFLFGWTTGKRAVWIILPIIIMLFFSYVRGVRLNKYMILGLLAFPIMIYFGARLTPSLNPEHQVWGSFDLQHVWDYANKYQFGEEGIEGQRENIQESQQVTYDGGAYGLQNQQIEAAGRGNATIELFKLIFGPRSLTEQDIWGTGLSSFYSTTYEEFDKLPLTIHLSYKGAGTGFFQMYATLGVVGAILMTIFSLIPYFRIKHRRIKWVMMVFFLYDYFMYNATTCRDTYLVAMIFICIFSVNYEYLKAKFHCRQMIQDSIKYQPHNLGYPKQAKNNPAE